MPPVASTMARADKVASSRPSFGRVRTPTTCEPAVTSSSATWPSSSRIDCVLCTAAASAFVYYRRGDILPAVAAPLVVGVFVGSLAGARLAPRIHHKWVARLLVTIMLYLSVHMLAHIVGKFL